ncbi:MAG TPA: RHS repeat-associated core domain-containing protein [Acidobacteriaceae bacterium]|jgi:RHS repeat-associated protein|nr:RHS repeat-associated core domain-containing protein [Acidobacteriaceae bacterium]
MLTDLFGKCRLLNLPVALSAIALLSINVAAQTPTDLTLGMTQNSSYHGGDIDAVNLGTDNLVVKIPLVSYPQRGSSLKLEYDFVYNGGTIADRTWCPSNPGYAGTAAPPPDPSLCIKSWNAPPNASQRHRLWGLADMQDVRTGFYLHNITPTEQQYGSQSYSYAYASFATADGAIHIGEPSTSGIVQRTIDGSGFVTNLDFKYLMTGTPACSANCFTRDANGITYYPNGQPTGTSFVIRQDSSGNQITGTLQSTSDPATSGYFVTDTVGRQIGTPIGLPDASVCGSDVQLPVIEAVAWTVPGPTSSASGTLKYIFCYASVEVFIPNGVNELQDSSGNLIMYITALERIILPNSQKWTFQYDSSNGPNPSYGDLTKIILPTGGSISYTYGFASRLGGIGRGVLTRTVDAANGSAPQTWTYLGGNSPSNNYSFTTTVRAPSAVQGQPGDDTVHTFMSATNPIETNVTQYQGPASNGQVLQSVSTTYDPTYGSPVGSDVFTQGFFPQTVTTTIDGALTSQKVYQYCCNFTVLEGTETYGLVSDVKTYDFGSGSPGGLLKEESTQYLFQSVSQYGNDNMLDYVSSKTVSGGGATAQTTYNYDEPAYLTTASGSVPGFGAPNTAHPGLATTEIQSVSGGSTIATHTKFYTTGEKSQEIDARNVVSAAYTYSAAYGFALPSQVTNAMGQNTLYSYDPNTGQKLSSQDPNNQMISWAYDATGRVSRVSYPDGGWLSYCYNDLPNTCSSGSGSVNSVVASKAENASQTMQVEVDVDGLGRKTRTSASEGSGSFLYTDTSYDALGRVQAVSNPYRSTADLTYGTTQYVYDGLARKVEEIAPDSSTSWWCYDGHQTSGQPNCVSNVISGNTATWADITDKEGKHWQQQSDGLGRLTGVVEPNPTSGALALKTQYGYDGLGDLVSVNQTGNGSETARTRGFIYDSLGRLTNSSNPETGAITYAYLAAGSLCAGDVTLPCSKTDARGVITNYSYDSLNRLISKSYVNSKTPSVSYGYDTSAVSGATNTVGRLTSETVSSGQILSQRQPYGYDPMGRITEMLECTVANCAGNPYHLAYKYDLDGNVIRSTNGIPNAAYTGDPTDLSSQFGNTAVTFNGSPVPSVLISTGYDNVGRPIALTSSWADTGNHPGTLFQAAGTGAYSPAGLATAVLGYNQSTSQTTVNLVRTYDNRFRVLSEVDTSSDFVSSPATASSGTITISGVEGQQSVAGTHGTGSIRIAGAEGVNVVCTTKCTSIYDTGNLSVTVGGFTVSAGYQKGSTATTITNAVIAALNQSGSPVTAAFSSGSIIITSVAAGTIGNYSYSVTNGEDFFGTDAGATMTGGTNGYTTPDTGDVEVVLKGTTFSIPWGASDTLQTVTSALANSIQSTEAGVIAVSSSPGAITLRTVSTGAAANGSLTCSAVDTASQAGPSSFSISCNGMTGGTDAYAGPKQLYSYAIPSNGGYTRDGNIASVNDSVTGSWTYTYDYLNRLSGATANSGTYMGLSIAGGTLSWTYDSFGNRLTQSSNGALFPTRSTQYSGGNNRAVGTGLASSPTVTVDSLQYDLAGNLVGKDGNSNTAYDAEGRICAIANTSGGYLAYVYDAEGTRAAKGTVNSLSCDFSSNGFAPTISYVVGASGDDLTEFDFQNGQWAWSHSDVNEGGQLLATYSGADTSFSLHDWLGTKRVEVTPDSLLSTFSSLPFGDGLTASGNAPDVSEKHFTGKERDAESGLDYFGARYYASTMGHWMSPDWSAKAEPVPYANLPSPQTLNLYSYVENNPITGMDPDGHYLATWLGSHSDNVGGMQMQGQIDESNQAANQYAQKQAQQNIGQDPTLPTAVDSVTVTAKPSVWKRIGSWFGGAAHGVSYAATVFIIKHSKLAMEGNKSSFEYWSKQSNEDIIKSLNPGGKEPMQVRMDGENANIINGNMRYSILQSRGADLGGLKPEVLPPVTIGPMIEPTIEPEIIP